MSSGFLFYLSDKILEAPIYIGLYQLALRMKNGSVLTAVEIKRCAEVELKRTATKEGFVEVDFSTGVVLQLE